jgi:DNA repair photolyase
MKAHGNMYQWAKPWNPLGGECPHKCSYCSTKTMMRFPEVRYKYSGGIRLFSTLYKNPGNKDGQTIFVCAQNDLFAKDVPDWMIKAVLKQCKIYSQHTYFFQTKNPVRYLKYLSEFMGDSILCTTIETNRWYPEIMRHAPHPELRANAMNRIQGFKKHVTVEPIIQFDLVEMVGMIRYCNPTSVHIGADSKGNNLPEPTKEKLLALIDELQKFTTIERKTNLKRLMK